MNGCKQDDTYKPHHFCFNTRPWIMKLWRRFFIQLNCHLEPLSKSRQNEQIPKKCQMHCEKNIRMLVTTKSNVPAVYCENGRTLPWVGMHWKIHPFISAMYEPLDINVNIDVNVLVKETIICISYPHWNQRLTSWLILFPHLRVLLNQDSLSSTLCSIHIANDSFLYFLSVWKFWLPGDLSAREEMKSRIWYLMTTAWWYIWYLISRTWYNNDNYLVIYLISDI